MMGGLKNSDAGSVMQCPQHDLSISDELFLLFSDLIYRKSGIRLSPGKKGLISSRLAKRLLKCGTGDFYDYYRVLKEDDEELVEMLNCISTNTTNLFRENHHFEYLKNKIIPDLLQIRESEKTLRIWSAGCSTGEEPYSIAIAVSEALASNNVKSTQWDVKILATDISTKVLEHARRGIYEYDQVPEGMQKDLMARYFLKGVREVAGKIQAKDFLKKLITFRRLNLKEEAYPFSRGFDVIFCRNVMIYFDENMKRHVIAKFYHYLQDNGHLFLGHSETMIGRDRFAPVHITVYKKK